MAIENKLTISQIKAFNEKGFYPDGGGLYLQVSKTCSKSWIYRFKMDKVSNEMGLGSLNDISLAEARELRNEARKLKNSRINPIVHRKKNHIKAKLAEQSNRSFKDCAEEYIKIHTPSWKNVKHGKQWTATLETYAYPFCGETSVDLINHETILKILSPIWEPITETATRVRSRIERILDWAKVKQYRSGENPARWRGNLEHALPNPTKIKNVQHQPSLPYIHAPEFIVKIRDKTSISARVIELLILTGARVGEVRCATWDEINLEEKIWVVPEGRMKGGIEHIVPLEKDSIRILKDLPKTKKCNLIFSGQQRGKPYSESMLLKMSKIIAADIYDGKITNHGFRTTFRTWASEETEYDAEALDRALAHQLKDKTQAAYDRGNKLKKRRRIMSAWADYCNGKRVDNVVSIRGQL